MPKAQSNLDPRIDLYISKAAPFARPILEHIREMVHRAWPEVVETMKWSQPFFTHANGKIIVSLGAFKQHCRVGVHHGDAAGALREAAGYERDAVGSVVRIESLKDLPPNKVLVASIRQAAESAATGKAMMRRQNQTPKPAAGSSGGHGGGDAEEQVRAEDV
jgi:hypothetical protein